MNANLRTIGDAGRQIMGHLDVITKGVEERNRRIRDAGQSIEGYHRRHQGVPPVEYARYVIRLHEQVDTLTRARRTLGEVQQALDRMPLDATTLAAIRPWLSEVEEQLRQARDLPEQPADVR